MLNRSGHFGEEKILFHLPGFEPEPPAHSLVAIKAETPITVEGYFQNRQEAAISVTNRNRGEFLRNLHVPALHPPEYNEVQALGTQNFCAELRFAETSSRRY